MRRFEKCETDPLGVFSAKIFEYWGRKGGPKSKFWGQNQNILNKWGPKQLIMIFPTHFKYSRALPTPFLINFGAKPQNIEHRDKNYPKNYPIGGPLRG